MSEPTYQISFSWIEDILQIEIAGKVSVDVANDIAQDVLKITDEHKPGKALIDCRKIIGRLGVIDTYYHVRSYTDMRHRVAKAAVVDTVENKAYDDFHEVTAANIGSRMNYFYDYEKALFWLRSE